MEDRCICCQQELSLMERNRHECWECQDTINITYSDDNLINLEDIVITERNDE